MMMGTVCMGKTWKNRRDTKLSKITKLKKINWKHTACNVFYLHLSLSLNVYGWVCVSALLIKKHFSQLSPRLPLVFTQVYMNVSMYRGGIIVLLLVHLCELFVSKQSSLHNMIIMKKTDIGKHTSLYLKQIWFDKKPEKVVVKLKAWISKNKVYSCFLAAIYPKIKCEICWITVLRLMFK